MVETIHLDDVMAMPDGFRQQSISTPRQPFRGFGYRIPWVEPTDHAFDAR